MTKTYRVKIHSKRVLFYTAEVFVLADNLAGAKAEATRLAEEDEVEWDQDDYEEDGGTWCDRPEVQIWCKDPEAGQE